MKSILKFVSAQRSVMPTLWDVFVLVFVFGLLVLNLGAGYDPLLPLIGAGAAVLGVLIAFSKGIARQGSIIVLVLVVLSTVALYLAVDRIHWVGWIWKDLVGLDDLCLGLMPWCLGSMWLVFRLRDRESEIKKPEIEEPKADE